MICAFTGHRKINNTHQLSPVHQLAVIKAVKKAVEWKFNEFRCGMALGADMTFADAVMSNGRQLHCYVPYQGFELGWSQENQDLYNTYLEYASKVVYTSEPPFAKWKMLVRDKVMVKDTTLVIALWDGRVTGGTYHTIEYAKQLGIPIYNCYDERWLTDNRYD